MGANGREIFEMQTIQPNVWEILRGKSNRTEIPGQKFLKIWIYLMTMSSFPKILETPVPFVTGNFQKFKREFFIKWKVPKVPIFGSKIYWAPECCHRNGNPAYSAESQSF